MTLLRFEEFTAQPRRAAALQAKLREVPGGRLFGLWRAQIGPSVNRVTRASLWPGEPPAAPTKIVRMWIDGPLPATPVAAAQAPAEPAAAQ